MPATANHRFMSVKWFIDVRRFRCAGAASASQGAFISVCHLLSVSMLSAQVK